MQSRRAASLATVKGKSLSLLISIGLKRWADGTCQALSATKQKEEKKTLDVVLLAPQPSMPQCPNRDPITRQKNRSQMSFADGCQQRAAKRSPPSPRLMHGIEHVSHQRHGVRPHEPRRGAETELAKTVGSPHPLIHLLCRLLGGLSCAIFSSRVWLDPTVSEDGHAQLIRRFANSSTG